jgi:hypothetical protein
MTPVASVLDNRDVVHDVDDQQPGAMFSYDGLLILRSSIP